MIDRNRLAELNQIEVSAFEAAHPKSKAAYAAADHLFGRVPMTWMNKKSTGFPIYFDRAQGNRVWDIDGHEYIDFALGDTGAMAGHRSPEVVAAIVDRVQNLGGLTTMMPYWLSRSGAFSTAMVSSRFPCILRKVPLSDNV